jgi:hypothetical protein
MFLCSSGGRSYCNTLLKRITWSLSFILHASLFVTSLIMKLLPVNVCIKLKAQFSSKQNIDRCHSPIMGNF